MKKTYLIAGLIVVVMSLWLFSGVFKKHPAAHETAAPSASDTPAAGSSRVRTTALAAEHQHIEVVLRGRTEAKRMIDVKAETGGRVIAVRAEKGQRVKAGDVLCELAEDDRRVRLGQAQAAFEKASIDYEGALRLKKESLLAATSIAASKSALESARAALKAAELDVQHLQMRAPFDGYVEDRPAEIGALLERGAVCARLLDESSLLATGQASEREVAPLREGQPAKVRLADGQQVTGIISFIGRAANPQTRTYLVEVALVPGEQPLRDGITVQITIPLQEVMAHRISPAVLALDDAGRVGVRIVNDQHVVEFHHVQVVRETAEGVWVTGLPPRINLITVGQELVAEGDRVDATTDRSASFAPGNHAAGSHTP